jgi:hypothetical protein
MGSFRIRTRRSILFFRDVRWSAFRVLPEPPISWYLLPRLGFNILMIFFAGVTPPSDPTTGIIVIAVVCCVLGTSLVWVFIIYHTRCEQSCGNVISFYGYQVPVLIFLTNYGSGSTTMGENQQMLGSDTCL